MGNRVENQESLDTWSYDLTQESSGDLGYMI